MARNDLRARGGLGGREAPHQLGVGVARSATPTHQNLGGIKFIFSFFLSMKMQTRSFLNEDTKKTSFKILEGTKILGVVPISPLPPL